MIPAVLPLTLWRGDTARLRVTCWADPARTTPADLSAASATAEIRRGTAFIAALACAITANVIDVTLAAADSAKLPPSGCVWDLQLVYSTNGDVQTPLAGPVIVKGDATAAP